MEPTTFNQTTRPMKNSNKRLSTALGAFVAFVLLGTIVYQTDLIGELKQGLDKERRRADKAEEELQVKTEMVEQLATENQVLQDSIEGLKLEIATLEETIQQQKTQISHLNRIISTQEAKVTRLSRKIEELEGNSAANNRKIQDLEAERNAVLQDMARMDQLRSELQQAHQEINRLKAEAGNRVIAIHEKINPNNAPAASAASSKEEAQSAPMPVVIPGLPAESAGPASSTSTGKLTEVLAQTGVIYHEVSLRKKLSGSNLKEIDARNWHYTIVNLDLDHPNKKALVGEVFVIMIHDKDTDMVVPMNEKNPEFPDSPAGSIGYLFRYRGEPVQIRYFNNQLKNGSNYEIRFYHKHGEHYVPLPKGARQIVKGGVVVAN
jgi:predicted  nucleic acid-binding Zn-ribbon protein